MGDRGASRYATGSFAKTALERVWFAVSGMSPWILSPSSPQGHRIEYDGLVGAFFSGGEGDQLALLDLPMRYCMMLAM